MPKHGEERNRHIKRTYDDINVVAGSGEKMNIEYCSSELTVSEKYCEHCGEYVSTESIGLLGFCVCPQCHEIW